MALFRQASYWPCSGRPLIGFVKPIGRYWNISFQVTAKDAAATESVAGEESEAQTDVMDGMPRMVLGLGAPLPLTLEPQWEL